jgi:hypothetical protein
MRALVCGGRDFTDMKALSREMAKIRDWYGGISCVIQGGARGADYLAKLWAEREGIPVIEIQANWNRYGKRAGHLRNGWMIEHGKPDVVVAFPGGRGTESMLSLAGKAELLIWTPLASCDTRPEGGDSTEIEAPFTGGAVPEGQTPGLARGETPKAQSCVSKEVPE